MQSYNLVRTHDGNGAFVIVDHDEEDAIQAKAPMSNIYSAGFNSSRYTLSLRRNYRRGFVTDFGRIEGLPGALGGPAGLTFFPASPVGLVHVNLANVTLSDTPSANVAQK